MRKVILVAGARPNFMKIAPVLRELQRRKNLEAVLVHTGQHYDDNMSRSFLTTLAIREPDYFLHVGSGSHAVQTAAIMVEFEKVCLREDADAVVVVGDVNSTIAAGLVAKKLGKVLAHVEAGLRSWDRTMPEEINRIATDAIADIFFTTEEQGSRNLIAEGHPREAIHFVGNVMIDNLMYQLQRVNAEKVSPNVRSIKSRLPQKYICLTMHRPTNVDDEENLKHLIQALRVLAGDTAIVFPCHPRTRKRIETFGLHNVFETITGCDRGPLGNGVFLTEPMSFNDFLYLWKEATLVITDSGGLQEETTALNVPCITIRENTERPITVEMGSNIVVGTRSEKIVALGREALTGKWKQSVVPPLWDGHAAKRIVQVLERVLINRQRNRNGRVTPSSVGHAKSKTRHMKKKRVPPNGS